MYSYYRVVLAELYTFVQCANESKQFLDISAASTPNKNHSLPALGDSIEIISFRNFVTH